MAEQRYARIAAMIRLDIAAGQWRLGDRLPGHHELMAIYGAARPTIQNALAVLIREGTVEARHGLGTYVTSVPLVSIYRVGPEDRVLARMPDDDERATLGMAPAVPLLVIRHPDGTVDKRDAATVIIAGE